MKNFIFLMVASIALAASSAEATTADSISSVVDLELKITQEVKAQIQPVDPDAVVSTTVAIKHVNTDLVGTQMQAVGLFATAESQKIEQEDIESITVLVMSNTDPFPPVLAKMIENTVLGVSKKGRIQISKMDSAMLEAIKKNKAYQADNLAYQTNQTQQFDKMIKLTEDTIGNVPNGVMRFLALIGGLQVVLLILRGLMQMRSFSSLTKALSTLKFEAPKSSNENAAPVTIRAPETQSKPSSSTLVTAENPFKTMPTVALKSLFSDAYWCQQDAYASWAWGQLNPDAKVSLLESWAPMVDYARFLAQIEPVEGRYHLDSTYLKPAGYEHLSNDEILKEVRSQNHLWHMLSSMRCEAMPIGLKERIELMDATNIEYGFAWTQKPSLHRNLQRRIEIKRLTIDDEELLFNNPKMLNHEQRKQFPSLIWLAMLELPVRSKLLEDVPAQSLAEIWTGPAKVLAKISEALPEKKRTLVEDYAKKVSLQTNSVLLSNLSKLAIEALAPETAVTPPKLSLAS